jgi:asparagine synthase (glutamine-hydrolysing)
MENDDPWRDGRTWLARAKGNWLSAIQYLDPGTDLPLDILTKVDRTSMAHSLETRVPLLDLTLVEFVATIPPELVPDGNGGRQLFKAAQRNTVPDEVLDRRKQGFAVPPGHWSGGAVQTFADDVLLSRRPRQRQILDPECIEQLLGWQQHGPPVDSQIWTLISFELWCRSFLNTPAPVRLGAPAEIRSTVPLEGSA